MRVPWYITAEHGKTKNGSKRVYLWGHVVIHQPPKKGYPETTIYTSKLTVYPQKSMAKTKERVKIKRPGTLIKGKGMTAAAGEPRAPLAREPFAALLDTRCGESPGSPARFPAGSPS